MALSLQLHVPLSPHRYKSHSRKQQYPKNLLQYLHTFTPLMFSPNKAVCKNSVTLGNFDHFSTQFWIATYQ